MKSFARMESDCVFRVGLLIRSTIVIDVGGLAVGVVVGVVVGFPYRALPTQKIYSPHPSST